MLTRHSSRRRPLDTGFLAPRLAGARSYDRIAGYFSSSILEVAGEALAATLRCLAALDSDHWREAAARLVVGAEELRPRPQAARVHLPLLGDRSASARRMTAFDRCFGQAPAWNSEEEA